MEQVSEKNGDDSGRGALQRSRDVAARLSVSARKLRFSTSSSSQLFKAVGLKKRLSERLFAVTSIVLTVIILFGSNSLSVVYYGFLASDQYQSEARFTVRSAMAALGKDQLAKVTGIPSAKIVQDTQIVTNYIHSREIIDYLEKKISLRTIYSNPSIDYQSRLKDGAKAEEILEYWVHMVTVKVSPSSGIITVTVRAFSPDDAKNILQAVIKASENTVNDVNKRMWQDVIATAEANLNNATENLQSAQASLQSARQAGGILDVASAAQLLGNLTVKIEAEKMKLEQRYDSNLVNISSEAPQMKVLRNEISSKEKQLADLSSQLAGTSESNKSLANISVDLSQAELNLSLGQKQFASSVGTLEQVQFVSRQQLLYLDAFLQPTYADSSEYPKRGLWITAIAILSLLLWATLLGVLSMLRTHLIQ
ncbi:capsule biosynthesis protein [Rhizobium sp. PL01]|uniref:capsule biosynthesis protein n=1 Tax=Rhizobium sp. PL01 TaxID=3085631 RepID=UPI00298101D2|nr:capsule biosynthesis protein [Rhizobium sp. PL01]MDW5315992.1 capsule biosynthesis protein [Rhizobium sp. PL01]